MFFIFSCSWKVTLIRRRINLLRMTNRNSQSISRALNMHVDGVFLFIAAIMKHSHNTWKLWIIFSFQGIFWKLSTTKLSINIGVYGNQNAVTMWCASWEFLQNLLIFVCSYQVWHTVMSWTKRGYIAMKCVFKFTHFCPNVFEWNTKHTSNTHCATQSDLNNFFCRNALKIIHKCELSY